MNTVQKTIEQARKNGSARISTCDAPNWSREEHDEMLMLSRNQPEDIEVRYAKNFGVWDWTLIKIKTSALSYEQKCTIADALREKIEVMRHQLKGEDNIIWQGMMIGLLVHQRNIIRTLNSI